MTLAPTIEFSLSHESIAGAPAEHRGTGRDDVRLMVAHRETKAIEHDVFDHLDRHLSAGDVLVVNTSATMPAALDAGMVAGVPVRLHFASPAPGGLWAVEVRSVDSAGATKPGPDLAPQTLRLPGDTMLHLLAKSPRSPRLWIAAFEGPGRVSDFLRANGQPIRYTPGPDLSLSDYQTVFATNPGSAEMSSAARPFTTSMVTRLTSLGVIVAPLVLHAGVSSFEEGETPGEERYEVPPATAAVINSLRPAGGRVVAVGTTVVRALETVADETGTVHPGQGVTDLVITPDRGVRSVDALLTGWHEPRSSHLMLLEAFASRRHLQEIYQSALDSGYLWHEFGDELLIL